MRTTGLARDTGGSRSIQMRGIAVPTIGGRRPGPRRPLIPPLESLQCLRVAIAESLERVQQSLSLRRRRFRGFEPVRGPELDLLFARIELKAVVAAGRPHVPAGEAVDAAGPSTAAWIFVLSPPRERPRA